MKISMAKVNAVLFIAIFIEILGIMLIMSPIILVEHAEAFEEVGLLGFILFLLLAGLGIFLVKLSLDISGLYKKFQEYVTVLSRDPSGYIPGIAGAMGKPIEAVTADLNDFVKRGWIENGYIDRSNYRLIINNPHRVVSMVSVQCHGCGAVNQIPKGQNTPCEYCGTILHGR